jgi:hypothetical protein
MTLQHRAPEPQGDDWKSWARRMMQYLGQTRIPLVQQTGDESAADDGQLMWNRINGYPVVSKNGEWRQIVLSDGQYEAAITSDVTAALADTGYPLTFTATTAEGITNGTPASRIVFEEAGHYMASFSAQISSTSSSTVKFYFWPKLNGVDAPNSTIVSALHQNGATTVVSRATTFDVSAGDYLEAYWAVDATQGYLEATAATAFAPAAPASTIAITRLHG